MKIVIAIVLFSVIVLFHELGHFLLAKANGIRVNEFSLGLGPTIIGFKKGETKYSIKLLPFGGACMMEGEDGESSDDRSFQKKGVWQRISVVFAGPFFNFIMAFVFSLILIGCAGYDEAKIDSVMEGYPAYEAGIQSGDKIVKMNGKSIHFYREVSMYSTFHPGEEVTIVYERDGKNYSTVLTPKLDSESGRYLYGVRGTGERTKGNAWDVCKNSVYEVKYWICSTVESLKMLVTGGASVNEMSGPVGIVQVVGDTVEESAKTDGYFYAFLNVLNWGILLSANLGVMNLLPIPALDGGRLVFLLFEAITRKKIPPEKEGFVHFIGIIFLLGLMVLVMFNDIRKIWIG